MSTTILRLPAVKARTGLARSTIYLRIAQGTFPRPIRLGERSVGWVEETIEGYLHGLIAASGQPNVEHERIGRKGGDRG
jgi:prophage regulatory protein